MSDTIWRNNSQIIFLLLGTYIYFEKQKKNINNGGIIHFSSIVFKPANHKQFEKIGLFSHFSYWTFSLPFDPFSIYWWFTLSWTLDWTFLGQQYVSSFSLYQSHFELNTSCAELGYTQDQLMVCHSFLLIFLHISSFPRFPFSSFPKKL